MSKSLLPGKNNCLYRVVHDSVTNTRLICFLYSAKDDEIVLGIGDGVCMWQQQLTGHRLQSGFDSTTEKLRSAIEAGDVTVLLSGDKANLILGCTKDSAKKVPYELCKLPANTAQTELADLFFVTATRSIDLQLQLDEAEKKIAQLKQSVASAASAARGSVFDMTVDSKKKKGQQKLAPKQTGMSVINPGTKKRKTAQGIDYD